MKSYPASSQPSLRPAVRPLCLLLATLALALARTAEADAPTLKQVCGPQAQQKFAGQGQLGQLCSSAYINGNLWLTNDNNSRVNAAAAVVCAYSCLSGGLTSCASPSDAGGGSACSTAVNTGYKAYDYSQTSDANLASAKQNGASAVGFQVGNGGAAGTAQSGGPDSGGAAASGSAASAGGASSGGALTPACQRLQSTNSAQDRIACAAETDPSLPSFVQSPQFAADFQKVTGTSLQSVINLSGETIVDRYAAGGLQNAVASLNGKMSLTDLMKGARACCPASWAI